MTTSTIIPMVVPGTLGTNTGPGLDGILIGQFTQTDPATVLLKEFATAGLAYSDDGGLFVDETAALASATADDVEVFPVAPLVDDAFYVGHATLQFDEFKPNTSTQGAGTWTVEWQYWNGSAYVALSNVTDGTAGFTSATGIASVTWDIPVDWVKNTVDGVNAYWVRANITAFTSITTAPQLAQGFINTNTPNWLDQTAAFIEATTDDVQLLPLSPSVGDGLYVGHATERFALLELAVGQVITGTGIVITPKYWNGSAYMPLPIVDDDSVGYSATAGTYLIHFVPPADWVINTASNGPNGVAGYFIVLELTAFTTITQQPLGTQGWVYPLTTGAEGIPVPVTTSTVRMTASAQTVSAMNADSSFAIVNVTKGTALAFTMPMGDSQFTFQGALTFFTSDQVALIQVTEDGTTELADVNFAFNP